MKKKFHKDFYFTETIFFNLNFLWQLSFVVIGSRWSGCRWCGCRWLVVSRGAVSGR